MIDLPVLVISRDEILAVWYVPLVLSSWTLNLHRPSRTTIYVTLPLGFSTPLDKCSARAATPLEMNSIKIHLHLMIFFFLSKKPQDNFYSIALEN